MSRDYYISALTGPGSQPENSYFSQPQGQQSIHQKKNAHCKSLICNHILSTLPGVQCYVVEMKMLPDSAIPEQWRIFLHQCLANRIDIDEFTDLSGLMLARSPVKENELLDLLLEARASSSVTWDPLLPLYVDGLCKVGRVKSSSALASLLRHSSIVDLSSSGEGEQQSSPSKPRKDKPSTLMTDIKVIQDVMMFISTGSIPKTVVEAADIYSATVDWILAVVAWHNHSQEAAQQTGGLMGSPDAVSLFESLGILLAALSGTNKGLEALSSDSNQGMFCSRNSG